MTATDRETRSLRIQELVASNELNEATKLLMDFVRDFAPDRAKVREAIGIRQELAALRSDLRTEGKTDVNLRRSARVTAKVLELVDVVCEEGEEPPAAPLSRAAPAPVESTLSTVPSHGEVFRAPLAKRLGTRAQFRAPRTSRAPDRAAETRLVFEGSGITRTHRTGNVSFTLHPIDLKLWLGEITAVVGANGNGKTTLLDLVAGKLKPRAGTVTYPALNSNGSSLYELKTQIGVVPQELKPWSGRLADNLHFTAATRGLRGDLNQEEVDFITYRLGLEEYRDATWKELSGGFRMRFELARVLLSDPKLLILDEPLANLDVNTQLLFLNDLRHLVRSAAHPMAALVSSQHLHEVEAIADRIVFLDDGKAVYNGLISDFGEDRDENCYEIACDCTREQLLDVLRQLACTAVAEFGYTYIVRTARGVNKATMLQTLLSSGVSIHYFRDISKSTRTLFEVGT